MTFEVKGKDFYRDGEPIKIISGAVHYFRNMPDTWRDIFKKMRAMGLNCVETYCAWNLHEPQEGEFTFQGNLDIHRFIKMAEEEGLMVIVRPGPYICAEWEFGGLPWWLQTKEDMEIRCMNEEYLKCFEGYLDRLLKEIVPLLATNGGPVIMVQCENEYGYYGDDKEYLAHIKKLFIEKGVNVPLFTSDGTSKNNLLDGTIEGCIPMLNFGSRVESNFSAHDELFPDMPKVCMEMWNGWFDAWGDEKHHTTSCEDYVKAVTDMLNKGSLNMYMFIGGTNFGFMNGANHGDKFAPQVTSYDYDALLSECGDVTDKYYAVRKVIQGFCGETLPDVPPNRAKRSYGKVALTKKTSLFDNLKNLSTPIHTNLPKNMESYGIGYGYIAYRTILKRDYKDAELEFMGLGDRAQIFVGEKLQGTAFINENLTLTINANAGDILTILVENMGRANFGPKMMRKKGIYDRLLLDNKLHFSWDAYPLPMDNLDKLDFSISSQQKTGFFMGNFNIDEVADTFLDLENFTKGFVTINGFNVGRYWEIGLQKRLYIPAGIIKKGKNEIIVFETDGVKGKTEVEFVDTPSIG